MAPRRSYGEDPPSIGAGGNPRALRMLVLCASVGGSLSFNVPSKTSVHRELPRLSLIDDGDGLDLFGDSPPPRKRDGGGDESTGGGSGDGSGGGSRRRRRSGGGGGGGGGSSGGDGGGAESGKSSLPGGDSDGSSSSSSSFTVKDVLKGRAVSGLDVPNGIGVGTLAWGDKKRGFNSDYNIADLQGAYNTLVEGGISFFDSSELYGSPFRKQSFSAEQMLGKFSNENFRYDATVATKYSPGLFAGGGLKPRFGRRAVVSALEESLERLERGYVDVYQLEAPYLPYVGGNKALYEGIARAKERGLCNAVGVSNFNAKQVKAAHAALAELGVPLVSNQVEVSLLNQQALAAGGTVDTCKRLGVTVLGHTPLAKGLGSGKYTATNPTGGKFDSRASAGSVGRSPLTQPSRGGRPPSRSGPAPGAKYSFDELRRWLPIHNALESVARSASIREEKKVTPAQVALNWVVAKGVVPLPGVTTNADAVEVAGCVGWRLRAQDIETLDAAYQESLNTKVEKQRIGYTQY